MSGRLATLGKRGRSSSSVLMITGDDGISMRSSQNNLNSQGPGSGGVMVVTVVTCGTLLKVSEYVSCEVA